MTSGPMSSVRTLVGVASSDSSEESEEQGSSDSDVYSPRQLRSSRSDDSDREKKSLKGSRKLQLGREPLPLGQCEDELPPPKRRKMVSSSTSLIKIEPKSMDSTFIPSSAASTNLPSPVTAGFAASPVKKKKKRIPYTLVEASKGNKCPTENCDGLGHITGLYAMHFAVSGCPLAHGKTADECKARRDELNRLRSKNTVQEEAEKEEPLSGSGYSDRPIRKVQRPATVSSLASRPIVGSTPLPKKLSSRVRSNSHVSVYY